MSDDSGTERGVKRHRSKRHHSVRWWLRSWFVTLMLIVFPPIGIILARMNPSWENPMKIATSVVSSVWMFIVLAQFLYVPETDLTPITTLEETGQAAQPTTTMEEAAAVGPNTTIVIEGRGQQASSKFTLEEGVAIFRMTHDGSKNFMIRLLDQDGRRVEGLVNEVGPFQGNKIVGVKRGSSSGAKPGVHLLDITADGNWKVEIQQPRPVSVTSAPLTLAGQGQSVSPPFVLNEGLAVFQMTHNGSRNFVIMLLDENGQRVEGLVNEIGSFSGSKAVGVKRGAITGAKPGIHLLDIIADGNWSVRIEQ